VLVAACAPAPGPGYPALPVGRFSTPIHRTGDLQVWRDQVYASAVGVDGTTVQLAMDVVAPAGLTAPTPTVVLVHGGGFAFGSRSDMDGAAASYARRGFVVATIDYRLDPQASSSDQRYFDAAFDAIDDGMEAVRWVKAHATTFHVDTGRIAVVGSSAGGAIALGIGMMDDLSPDGPLAAYDTHIAAAVSTGASLTPAIGTDLLTFEPTDAPSLLFHHLRDSVTGFTAPYSYRTCDGLVAVGVPCRFITNPGTGHTVSVSADGPWWQSEIGPFLWAQLHLADVA